jgi:hypothetical protein
MRITSETVAGGIREQLFTVGDVPGVLWTPAEGSGPRPLVLIGHGGGQHKKEPGVISRAFPYVATCCFAVEPRITAAVLGLIGSDWLTEKTLHANPGAHREVPSFEIDSSIRFFARHLRPPVLPAAGLRRVH